MAEKRKTKSQIIAGIAEKAEISKKQGKAVLEALVAMAYKEAVNGFKIPGLGKLLMKDRQARMGRNPATGAIIQIPAKRVLKFRVAKDAKEAILK